MINKLTEHEIEQKFEMDMAKFTNLNYARDEKGKYKNAFVLAMLIGYKVAYKSLEDELGL